MELSIDQQKKLWFIELEPHLNEFKNRSISILLIALIFAFLNFFVAQQLIQIVSSSYNVISLVPSDAFNALLFIDFVLTIAMIFPFVVYSGFKYVEPAFETVKSFKMIKYSLFVSILLFYLGIAFGLLIFSPILLNYFTGFSLGVGIETFWGINKLIGFLGTNALIFGFIFQIPLVTFLLIKFKVIKADFLLKNSYFGIPIVLTITAFITPPDIISMFLMAAPIFALFYGSIFITKIFGGGK